MKIGKTYYMVCERISNGKHWFGSFWFSADNPCEDGRFWLHPRHDLVFRTYLAPGN